MSTLNKTSQLPPPVASDEIDLFELFSAIWRQKKWIAGLTFAAGVLGASYAFLTPNVYQSTIMLAPVSVNSLDALNRSGLYNLTPTDVLGKVREQLSSSETRQGFFKANPNLFKAYQQPGQSLDQSFVAFNSRAISLILPDPKKSEVPDSFVGLQIQYPKDVEGAAILNGFVDYALAAEQARMRADFKKVLGNRLDQIKLEIDTVRARSELEKVTRIAQLLDEDKIKRAHLKDELTALRFQLKTRRNDRLQELAEAISIAKSLGIKKPAMPSSTDTISTASGQIVRIEVNYQNTRLYFLGSDALEAERAALGRRTNNDFTSKRVAEIGKQLQMLKVNREVEILRNRSEDDVFLKDALALRMEEVKLHALNIDTDTLAFATVEQRAQESPSPIKPRKLFIIALSLVGGLGLGVVLALMYHFVQSLRVPRSREQQA